MAEVSDKLVGLLDFVKFYFYDGPGDDPNLEIEAAISDGLVTFTVGEVGREQYDARFSLTADELEGLAEAARIAANVAARQRSY